MLDVRMFIPYNKLQLTNEEKKCLQYGDMIVWVAETNRIRQTEDREHIQNCPYDHNIFYSNCEYVFNRPAWIENYGEPITNFQRSLSGHVGFYRFINEYRKYYNNFS